MPDQTVPTFTVEERVDVVKLLLLITAGIDSPNAILKAINHFRCHERREMRSAKWCTDQLSRLTQQGFIQQLADGEHLILTATGWQYLISRVENKLVDLMHLIDATKKMFRGQSAS